MFIFIISNPTLFFVFTPHFTNFNNWVSLVIGEATGGISCVQGGVLWRIFHHTLVYCVLGLLLKNVFVGAVGEVLIMLSGGMSALLMQPMTLPPPAEPWPPHGSFHSPSLSGLWALLEFRQDYNASATMWSSDNEAKRGHYSTDWRNVTKPYWWR